MRKKITAFCLSLLLLCLSLSPALAWESTTLGHGMRGEEVKELQQALINLGYLKGTADGIYGNKTENAVRAFQRKNKLSCDGLAGAKTRALIMDRASASSSAPAAEQKETAAPAPDTADASSPSSSPSSSSSSASSSSSLFGGNYATLRSGSSGSRVRTLQKALISLNYLAGSADGKFGAKTKAAVLSFQKASGLKADGAAGRQTLTKLEKACSAGEKAAVQPAETASSEPAASRETPAEESLNPVMSVPGVGSLVLLRWYDDVKPALASGQHLLVCDPSTGLNWTLRVYARGRHCDAEPLTARDTATMLKAFGGTNTWNQKGVYVRLPDGRWTIGSTHDVPHDTSSVKDNNFNGHLCVHFLRPMEETKQNDPSYGVANQNTLRAMWKSLTGEEITD